MSARTDARRAAGLCPLCGKVPEDVRYKHCAKCRTRALIHTYRYRWKAGKKRSVPRKAVIPHGPTHWPPHCECGRGRIVHFGHKADEVAGCRQCVAMDGAGPRQFDVIQTLRSVGGPMTIAALSMELQLRPNTAGVLLDRLVRAGYLRKRLVENREDSLKGGKVRVNEYRLAGRLA